ncbi:hypothetical protein Ssi03_02160 [Sphaerisporangium siamense]|uniref:Streptomyces killer toxin-like beta/gamma crystallin domain-containing protein n=1 Tax=Sphaerisporangium siamense TaxID=795645 RepID=A0A7W7DE77_9ACTN|nr:hypothetical protein [Sphaerisporangium siamense]MBB4703758.1 hypothetical protein [Sphaerisporangium siamense]GII82226.1 hypothetical protein Ssi03_02160 [Sphaerisporangium siamense]
MNARRFAATAFATVLATTGLVAATASGANAAPTGCTYTLDPIPGEHGASSYCSGGTGEHRIFVMEKHFLAEAGLIPVWGPWVPAGQTSYTRLPYHTIIDIRVDVR